MPGQVKILISPVNINANLGYSSDNTFNIYSNSEVTKPSFFFLFIKLLIPGLPSFMTIPYYRT